MAKKKQLKKYPTRPKTNKKCFNYGKKGIILGTATLQTKKSPKSHQKKPSALNGRKIKPKLPPPDYDNFNIKPYPVWQVFISCTDKK